MSSDVAGLDPLTVSLRDYIDGLGRNHANDHQREREAVQKSLDAHDKYASMVLDDHFLRHKTEHEAVRDTIAALAKTLDDYTAHHTQIHSRDLEALHTALQSVQEIQSVHGRAHSNDHRGHELVHEREREAASLARVEISVLFDRINAAMDQMSKAADNAHTRMDKSAEDHRASMQKQIDDLKLVNAAGTGASARTGLLFAAAATLITLFIAIAGITIKLLG